MEAHKCIERNLSRKYWNVNEQKRRLKAWQNSQVKIRTPFSELQKRERLSMQTMVVPLCSKLGVAKSADFYRMSGARKSWKFSIPPRAKRLKSRAAFRFSQCHFHLLSMPDMSMRMDATLPNISRQRKKLRSVKRCCRMQKRSVTSGVLSGTFLLTKLPGRMDFIKSMG